MILDNGTASVTKLLTSFVILLLMANVYSQVTTSTCNGQCLLVSNVKSSSEYKSGLGMCFKHLPDSEYVCMPSNYTSIDASLLSNYKKNSKFLPDDESCTASWKRFSCLRNFPSCYPSNNTALPVCYSECIKYTDSCWNRDRGYNPFNWFYQGVFFLNTDLDKKFKYFCVKNSAGLVGQSGDVINYSATPVSACTQVSSVAVIKFSVTVMTLISMLIVIML